MTSQFISTEQLAEHADNSKLVILDASWHLPTAGRDPKAEYLQQHIPNAVFFDIDGISDKSSSLPHMLPSEAGFSQSVSAMGVSNDSEIVVYDSVGLMSAARCWWTFRVFGHCNVRILAGGLPGWMAEGRSVVSGEAAEITAGDFSAEFMPQHVAGLEDLFNNCSSGESKVLDARSEARFYAEAPEPRPGLKGGHIPGSSSLPFDQLISDGRLKPVDELRTVFESLGVSQGDQIITSCGSGVTASIITLALEEAGYGLNRLYDGSWSEWGGAQWQGEDVPVSSSRD